MLNICWLKFESHWKPSAKPGNCYSRSCYTTCWVQMSWIEYIKWPRFSQEPSNKRVRPLAKVSSLVNLISPSKNGAVRRFGQTIQVNVMWLQIYLIEIKMNTTRVCLTVKYIFVSSRCHYVVIPSHQGRLSKPAAKQQARLRPNAGIARCGRRPWTSIKRAHSPPKRSRDKRF